MSTPAWIGGEWVLSDLPATHPLPSWAGPGVQGSLVSSGRAALTLCSRHLGGGPVLIPAYGCPALTQAVTTAGGTAVYYPGDAQMGPLWSLLPGLARRHGAHAVLIVHPLGWLRETDAVLPLRQTHGLAVVEDASHTLGNAPNLRCLGPTVTSAVAASLRKVLPMPTGGFATVPDGPMGAGGDAFAAARTVAFRLPPGPQRHRALSRAEGVLDAGRAGGPLPAEAARVLTQLAATPEAAGAQWRGQCRQNWSALLEGLRGTTCRPVFAALPDGVCPAGFAVRAHSRTRLAQFLLQRHIEATLHWPIAPEARQALSREEHLLAGTILTLPCDGRYGTREMDDIIAACRAFDRAG